MCDDFASEFDSDDFGSNDFDSPAGDETNDAMFEEAARFADYAQWGAPSSKRAHAPHRLRQSEIRRIRRRAFIWKRKKIKVGYNTGDLLNKNVEIVYILLFNQAFKYINLVPEQTIGPRSRKKEGSVRAVEIGECTSFRTKDKFPYDTAVTIYYRTKRQIPIPFSAKSVRKRNFEEICNQLEALGFSHILRKPKRNIVAGWLKTEGAIDKVSINDNCSYKEGEPFPFDVQIIVEYDSRLF